MGFMENVIPRGKKSTFNVKLDIPKDVRHAFGGKTAVWKSLRTNDPIVAMERAAPIIAGLKREFEQARASAHSKSPSAPPPSTSAPIQTISPERAASLIALWRSSTITRLRDEHWSGSAPTFSPFGDESVRLAELRYRLAQPKPWDTIPDFRTTMASALSVHPTHPILSRKDPCRWFADAWRDVEAYADAFRRDDFSDWVAEEPTDSSGVAPQPGPTPTSAAAAVAADHTLSELVETYCKFEPRKQEADVRFAFERLQGWFGDCPIRTVTAHELVSFKIALAKFPKGRSKEITRGPFREIVSKYGDRDEVEKLSAKTVWKTFVLFKAVFEFAVGIDWLVKNPVAGAMPRKPSADDGTDVRAYSPEEIGAMFSKPLFRGFSGDGLTGYRKVPGDNLIRDAKFWLPIFALWHGCRMEEIGGAKLADIKTTDSVLHFDWRQRRLKTPAASRLLPIHPRMKEFGFLEYVQARRSAGDTYLFPELPHNPTDGLASTRQFSKWWGLWSDANGFEQREVNFHSFRHTFKRQCRGSVDEELHDLITGHKGQASVGRTYGGGAFLTVLLDALSKVNYPTFTLDQPTSAAA